MSHGNETSFLKDGEDYSFNTQHFSQVLKGAVGTTLCQNEAELKFSMENDHQTSSTDQAVKVSLIFPANFLWKFPCGILLLPHSGRGSH